MEQKPYLRKTIKVYNPEYGDRRVCKTCGMSYIAHFTLQRDVLHTHDFEEAEQTYRWGDIFKRVVSGCYYILSQVGCKKVCLPPA